MDKRSTAMLLHLVQAQSYVPVTELTEKFKVSRRTIYYDIEKINTWLKDHHLDEVKHVRTAGFRLDDEVAKRVPALLGRMNAWDYENSSSERKGWLAIYVLTRNTPLFLEQLMERSRVSRNTTLEDLKGLKAELTQFDLELVFERKSGYMIIGREDNKRKMLAFYVQQVLSDQNWQTILARLPLMFSRADNSTEPFDLEKMKAIQAILVETEEELNVIFTDEFMLNLSLGLLLFVRRLSLGKRIKIDPIEKEVLKEAREYQEAVRISGKLSKLFEVYFPEDEVFYITKHLLSSRVHFSEELHDVNDSPLLNKVVEGMVTDFQKYACVFFEHRDEVEKNLMLHVKPAYYRVKYGLEDQSDAADLIKDKYQDIFLLTKKVIHHLEEAVGKPLCDNEVALIATHFGGWMRKVGAIPPARKKALLVCTKGLGTSRLLQHQLEGLFSTVDIIGSVSLRGYEERRNEADLIISTISLDEKEKPVFVVSPILTDAEKENLLQKVNALMGTAVIEQRTSAEAILNIIEKHADIHNKDGLRRELRQYLTNPVVTKNNEIPSLTDLLPIENISVRNQVADWKESIKIAAGPLLAKKSVTEDYVQAMIDTLIRMGPYIVVAPKVAIPHARPEDGVNKLGMSLLRLTKAVSFSENGTHPVNLIIVLATSDGESHLKALGELTDLLSKANNIDSLIKAKSPTSIFHILAGQKV